MRREEQRYLMDLEIQGQRTKRGERGEKEREETEDTL